ncbi:MAG TPA: hypothetical protein VK471_11990 [Solirubrobacterales bacterium]|nr:hypothetical protein [Solirubrobacterales bacterium]
MPKPTVTGTSIERPPLKCSRRIVRDVELLQPSHRYAAARNMAAIVQR